MFPRDNITELSAHGIPYTFENELKTIAQGKGQYVLFNAPKDFYVDIRCKCPAIDLDVHETRKVAEDKLEFIINNYNSDYSDYKVELIDDSFLNTYETKNKW